MCPQQGSLDVPSTTVSIRTSTQLIHNQVHIGFGAIWLHTHVLLINRLIINKPLKLIYTAGQEINSRRPWAGREMAACPRCLTSLLFSVLGWLYVNDHVKCQILSSILSKLKGGILNFYTLNTSVCKIYAFLLLLLRRKL